ncbi:MAG TPA: hypothetical protein VLC71_10780 [Thermomonas sp.]|nr:hypothetical protein [Thermomonas sp.]
MTAGHDATAESNALRQRAARRTALLFGGIAVAVYVGFLLMGVVGR